MAAQGRRLTTTGAIPAATNQLHLSAKPAARTRPATSHRLRRPPRWRRAPSSMLRIPERSRKCIELEIVMCLAPFAMAPPWRRLVAMAPSWRRLVGDDLPQEGDHLRTVPFGGADEA